MGEALGTVPTKCGTGQEGSVRVLMCVYERFPADGSGTPRNKKCHFGLRSHNGMFLVRALMNEWKKGS